MIVGEIIVLHYTLTRLKRFLPVKVRMEDKLIHILYDTQFNVAVPPKPSGFAGYTFNRINDCYVIKKPIHIISHSNLFQNAPYVSGISHTHIRAPLMVFII